MTSVPAGMPLWSAVTRTWSTEANARSPFDSTESSELVPCWSVTAWAQSPIAIRTPGPVPTAWPETTMPLIAEPEKSAVASRLVADARVRAVTLPTVTSPPNNVIELTSAEALAVADEPGAAKAPDVTDPAETTEPSAGNAKLPPTPTASGGAETEAAELPP